MDTAPAASTTANVAGAGVCDIDVAQRIRDGAHRRSQQIRRDQLHVPAGVIRTTCLTPVSTT